MRDIFIDGSKVLAGISVGAPEIRFTKDRIESLIPDIVRIAGSISAIMGYTTQDK